ncbi:hypothetical protein [Pseudalgibacter alginicilyticus]|nr:hypothetical protein [Pseudalgibacter alginicilyticus]
MPANKKYLMQSGWAQTSKVVASILGSLLASFGFHLALASYIWQTAIVATSVYSVFVLWGFLIIVVYWVKKPWVAWAILLSIIILSALAIYLSLH